MKEAKENSKVTSFQSDDLLTFDTFVNAYRDQALNFIVRKVGDVSKAEDVFFETLMSLHRNWPEGEKKTFEEAKRWIHQSIKYRLLDSYEKDGRLKNKPLQSLDELSAEIGFEATDTSVTTTDNILILNELLLGLSETDRLMFQMKFEGEDDGEIAMQTGYSVKYVASRLGEIRNKLQQSYKETQSLENAAEPYLEEWFTVVAAAAVIGDSMNMILVRLHELRVEYREMRTVGVYQAFHISESTVRRLKRIIATNRMYELQPSPEGYLTSYALAKMLECSEKWVLYRAIPYIPLGVCIAKGDGSPGLAYPLRVYEELKKERDSYPLAGDWLTMVQMKTILGRHEMWIRWRMPKILAKHQIVSEIRLDPANKTAEHWPPVLLAELQKDADRFPDKGELVSIGEMAVILGRDWFWVDRRVKPLGLKPVRRRIKGSGKIFPHYPVWVLEQLKEESESVLPAPKGWYTDNGLARLLGKGQTWVEKEMAKLILPVSAIYADEQGVSRTFYGPNVVLILKARAKEKAMLPEKGERLSRAEVATELGMSPSWAQIWIKKLKLKGVKCRNSQDRIFEFYDRDILDELRKHIR